MHRIFIREHPSSVLHVQPNASGVVLEDKIKNIHMGFSSETVVEIHGQAIDQRLELVKSP
jgi:hypothetical protein